MSISSERRSCRRWPYSAAALALICAVPALAQDATWNGSVNGNFHNAGNWTPGAVPSGTATFSGATPTAITSNTSATVGALAITGGTYSLTIGGFSFFEINGAGILNTSGNAFTISANAAFLQFTDASAGNALINNGGAVTFAGFSTLGTGIIVATPGTTTSFTDDSSAGAGTIGVANAALLQFASAATAGTANITVQSGGDAQFRNNSTAGNSTITVESGATLAFSDDASAGAATITARDTAFVSFADNATGGNARFIVDAGATLDFSGMTTGSTPSIGSLEGGGFICLCEMILTIGSNNRSTEFSGMISSGIDFGGITKVGTGTLILSGINDYLGPTTVNGGVLRVNGSIATSSLLTINAGGTVGGIGELPSTVVNGGILAPGNSVGTITVNGSLTFNPGSIYLVEVQGATADRANVTGAAALAGTVRLVPLGGAYAFNTPYTILRAAGGRTGTFATVDSLFGNTIRTTVSYDATSVLLVLAPNTINPTGGSGNQSNVATGINNGVANGGNATPFFPLYNLSDGALPQGLDSLSGEVHGARTALGFEVSDQFLRVMLDPFALGRTPGVNPALAYAPIDALAGMPGVVAATQAADLATGVPIDPRRFAVWAAAFGSDGRFDGNSGLGSHRVDTRTAGIAVGADMRIAPDTVIGIAAAGGNANASLSAGLGSLSAEVGQAGAYAMTRFGGLNIGAAIAYALLDVDSSRNVPALGATSLTGDYRVHTLSGRVEASFEAARFSGFGIAPLAAFQVHAIRSPSITEAVGPGGVGAAALAVQGETQHVSRSELGLRIDGTTRFEAVEVTAFARLAWAHYFDRDSSIIASFTGLPGSTFSVAGAQVDRDSALVSAGIDIRFTPQLSLGARFDGEFSENVARYAGTARVRLAF